MADGGPAPDDSTVRRRYEWSTTSPTVAVAETVADAAGRDPTALPPLFGDVDAAALDAFLRSDGTADPTVSFTSGGYEITVRGGGLVLVRPADGRTSTD
ncbi:HalOD1 output domain-containing protein [Halostella litorea]|uniref:HalOD1 output domain-containing protein n=1 Tax=Halostella litorea TaxID=2528831 RepID=UPI0010923B94|nr:HalOD1 output domain-containing protein [Halostella litorea]